MPILLVPFLILAVLGIFATLVLYVWTWFGTPESMRLVEPFLIMAVFAVLIPAMLVQSQRDFRRRPVLDVAFEGCPTWMRATVVAAAILFGLNFLGSAPFQPPKGHSLDPAYRPALTRMDAGFALWSFTLSTASLYSGIVAWPRPTRRCPQGHTIPATSIDCEFCAREAHRRLFPSVVKTRLSK